MQGQIRVVIADDHRLFREGIRLILRQEKGIEIVGEATSWHHTIDVISDLKSDVVLLDFAMPESDGIQVITPIREKSQRPRRSCSLPLWMKPRFSRP